MQKRTALATLLLAGMCWTGVAHAQDTIKVGVILPYSGPFADSGNQLQAGIDLYLARNGNTVAGKTVEIIRKDTGGPAPDVAQRLAQELVVRDGVDIIAGFVMTPNALGAAPVATEAQKLMVVMNAATSIITEKSEYIVRTGLTIPQLIQAYGAWAFEKGGIKTAYTLVADFGPGHDAEASFAKGFTDAGGTILGADRTPVVTPDFSAFVQRAKDANPDAVYTFVPGGAQPAAIGKAMADRGLVPPATKALGDTVLTTPEVLESLGAKAKGFITASNYWLENPAPLNAEFVAAYREANGGRAPDIYSVGGYDGMHLIFEALKATNGDASGGALVAAAKGMAWESPRGPMSIDPETRDVVQNIYIREVQEVDGKLQNVLLDTIPTVKDPRHSLAN
jgi:branched-chain amino acid transport system substrate-binding protein